MAFEYDSLMFLQKGGHATTCWPWRNCTRSRYRTNVCDRDNPATYHSSLFTSAVNMRSMLDTRSYTSLIVSVNTMKASPVHRFFTIPHSIRRISLRDKPRLLARERTCRRNAYKRQNGPRLLGFNCSRHLANVIAINLMTRIVIRINNIYIQFLFI